MLDESFAHQRLPFQAMAAVATALWLLSLLLASVGLYGVIAFLMSQRTREITIIFRQGAEARVEAGLRGAKQRQRNKVENNTGEAR